MNRTRLGGVVLVVSALCPSEGSAYCPAPGPDVHQEFRASQAVFVGTVLAERNTPAHGSYYEGWTYRVRVTRLFKGPTGDTIEVFTENSSGRRRLRIGASYVLFAGHSEGRLEITNCGHSGPSQKRPRTLESLEGLTSAQ